MSQQSDGPSSRDETDDSLFLNRRRVLQLATAGLGGAALSGAGVEVTSAERAECYGSRYERTYSGGTVNLGGIRAEQARGALPDTFPGTERPGSDATVDRLRTDAMDGESVQPSSEVTQQAASGSSALTVETEYDGVNAEETRGGVPSDSQIAVGDGKLVHALNQQVAIYSKDSGRREHMVRLERLWDPVIPEPEGGFAYGVPFVFDPRARYDREANRYVLAATQFQFGLTADGEIIDREKLEEGELDAAEVSRPPQGWWLVAVSASSNPNGRWHVYRVPPIHNEGLVDYPTLGLDRDAVYVTQNFFGETFEVSMATLDKEAMYAGEDVTAYHFTDLNDLDSSGLTFTVQPALQPFSGGDDGTFYLMNSDFPVATNDTHPVPFANSLTLWEVTDPTDDPSLDCFTIGVDPYSYPPPARQEGGDSTDLVDTLGTRLMNVDYDDGSLWMAHSLAYDWDGDGTGVSAVRWYEIDVASHSVVQSGVYGAPDRSYYIPTVGADGGSMVMVHSVSGPDTYVRLDVAGRTEGSDPGELEDSVTVQHGASNYDFGEGFGTINNPLRWGDYKGVSVDPSSGSFWVVGQYSPEAEVPPEDETRDPYHTRIAEVSFE